jgi:AmiR/NasT family two-component response regulator
MGVLMHQHRLTQVEAFDVLRAASQDSNRKLADIALEVVETGSLSIRGWPAGRLGESGAGEG